MNLLSKNKPNIKLFWKRLQISPFFTIIYAMWGRVIGLAGWESTNCMTRHIFGFLQKTIQCGWILGQRFKC